MNESAIYEKRRDQLLPLLQRGAEFLTAQPDAQPSWIKAANEMRATADRLLANCFNIVLLADMQGGKSTVFNTIACEGRELSPVGCGIRTSGCLVRAQNLPDPNADERAEVTWRTSPEIVASFDSVLLPHFQTLAPERFKAPTEKGAEAILASGCLADKLNLEAPIDLDLLRQAAERERDRWREDKRSYAGADEQGRLDVVRIALLIAAFYRHEEIVKLRQRNNFKPEEVSRLIRYPERWEERWDSGNGDPHAFRWNEITFVFVREVNFHLHAPKLKKIGAALVDCPGLFASRFDTQVADNALAGADAILFLVPGEKQASLSQLEVLQNIRNRGREEVLFFAWNMRTQRVSAERMLADLKAKLASHGFKVPANNYFILHAKLALRAEQAARLLDGGLDLHTREAIASTDMEGGAPEEVDQKIWDDVILLQCNSFPRRELLREQTEATLKTIHAKSGLFSFVAQCQDYVVRNQARFVLVENGAKRVMRDLERVEKDLQQREVQVIRESEGYQAQVGAAEKELKNFEDRCDSVLRTFESDAPNKALAEEFVLQLDADLRQEIGNQITERIFAKVIGWELLWKGLFRKKEIESEINAISCQILARAIDDRFSAWLATIQNGTSPAYRREIAARVDKVRRGIEEEWRKVGTLNVELLQGMPLTSLSSDIREAVQQAPGLFEANQAANPAIVHLQKGGALVLAAIASAVGAAVAAKVALATTWFTTLVSGPSMAGPVAWTLGALAVAILGAFWFLGGKDAAKAKLASKIAETLKCQWPGICDELKQAATGIGFGICKWYAEAFRNEVVSAPRRVLAERKREAERLFRASQVERERLAVAAKDMREKSIIPLKKDLEKFTTECEKDLAGLSQ